MKKERRALKERKRVCMYVCMYVGVVILSFASKSDDASSSSYGAGITSIGGR